MKHLKFPGRLRGLWDWTASALLLVLSVAPLRSNGQAVAEVAESASFSAGVSTAGAKELPALLPTSMTEVPRQDEVNRKALEKRAGKDAAMVLLQSVPSDAHAYVDGATVGQTPLLLILPPGKYKVEMRGPREEFGERLIDLPPNETQRTVLALANRYPSGFSLKSGRVLPSEGSAPLRAKVVIALTPNLTTESKSGSPAAEAGASLGEENRKALEQKAGNDAARLILNSVPGDAFTYIDGIFIGRTPVAVMVSPGRYKVEMRGLQREFGECNVGVLPNESQQAVITLAVRYPTRISLQ